MPTKKRTMVQNSMILRHLIIYLPINSKMSKWIIDWTNKRIRVYSAKQVSGTSKWAKRRASGPVLTSGFVVVLDHSELKQYPPSCSITGNSRQEIDRRCSVFPRSVCDNRFARNRREERRFKSESGRCLNWRNPTPLPRVESSPTTTKSGS